MKFRYLVVLFLAINLTGFAVALIVHSGLGSDTITMFIEGLAKVLNISLGTASRCYNFALLAIVFLIARKDLGWMTVAYACLTGFAIDFYAPIVSGWAFIQTSLYMKLLAVCIAQLCFALAYALLIQYRKGMNQLDALVYYVSSKTQFQYTVIRTFFDVLLVFGGVLMGAAYGVGTLITMMTTGYLVSQITQLFEKIQKTI